MCSTDEVVIAESKTEDARVAAIQIFDPFFSTRRNECGTGLGLSVAVGIVNEFGGTLSVASEPDTGTTATILLPRVDS